MRIIVKFSGGLGNQLFQFALYRELVKRYPSADVSADVFTYVLQDVHHGFELNRIFDLTGRGLVRISDRHEYKSVVGEFAPTVFCPAGSFREKLWAYVNARLRKKADRSGCREIIKEEPEDKEITEEYRDCRKRELKSLLENLDSKKNWYLDGYWQDTLYFPDAMEEMQRDLVFPLFEDRTNLELEQEIKESESVAIHVRRGDYVHSVYDVLSVDYYKKSVTYIEQELEKRGKTASYYVFSDDTDYVVQEFRWLEGYRVITQNTGKNAYRDLQLMSLCKHQITANSSFSIWSGYLNQNPERIVCYPEQYTKSLRNVEKKENGWVKVHVG